MAELRCGVSATRVEGAFRAGLAARTIGPLLCGEFTATRAEINRTRRDIAGSSPDGVFVKKQLGRTSALFQYPGQDLLELHPGDLMIADTDEPFESFTANAFHHQIWVIPRPLAGLAGLGTEFGKGVHIGRRRPVNRLLSTFLSRLETEAPRLAAAELESAVTSAAHLLRSVGPRGRLDEPLRAARWAGEFARLKSRIDQVLTHPLLSPGRIARDCGISVRKLHLLFERSGLTFSDYVSRQRLALARRLLTDPAELSRPISDIAFSLGFNSLATFYRVYRAVYDEAPGDTRASAPLQLQ